MIKGLAILFILLSSAVETFAQLGGAQEKAAWKSLEKQRWEKAGGQLHKILKKDSVNTLAHYLMATYFFLPGNPAYNLDSAYQHVIGSLADFQRASQKEREKLKRWPLDSGHLVRYRERIDSAAFEAARTASTEEAYTRFLERHPLALQRSQASDLRDEVAYLQAAKSNTHEAFLEFLNKYPQAAKAREAKTKYDRLLYEDRTKDRRLASFENFLRQHPETPFYEEIEQHIFELFTLSGEVERYLAFLQLYPGSKQVDRAYNILFHILQERDDPQRPGLFLTDSLENIRKLEQNYLAPVMKNGMFGFIDQHGAEIIPPVLPTLGEQYKCGNITDDVIVLPDKILARDGSQVYAGKIAEVDDLGTGFLKLSAPNADCKVVIHKSGAVMDACTDDAKVLGNRFLALLKDRQWYIHSLAGRRIARQGWDDVIINHHVCALKKAGQWYLYTFQQLVEMADQQTVALSTPYDEVKLLPGGIIAVSAKEHKAILNSNLQPLIPFTEEEIAPAFFGFTGHTRKGVNLYDRSGKPVAFFKQIKTSEPWLAAVKNNAWHLIDPRSYQPRSPAYDSIKFEGPFAIGSRADTIVVHFNDSTVMAFAKPAKARFIPGKDSTSFLSICTPEPVAAKARQARKTVEERRTVFNQKAQRLFAMNADNILYAGEGLFIVSKKEKKGLVNASGKLLLPVEYDAIGSATNQVISLLKATKFGMYHATRQKLIRPRYNKNVVPYTGKLNVAYHDGLYGFIDWDDRGDPKNGFDEIRYWNDTTALVKRGQQWMFYDITLKEVLQSDIKEVNIIYDSPDEKLAIIKQHDAYGVLSSRRGVVIPITFSDVVNIGAAEAPLYFTEKHVAEAAVFVVIYYDGNGRLLRREIYDNEEDYEQIYCPDN